MSNSNKLDLYMYFVLTLLLLIKALPVMKPIKIIRVSILILICISFFRCTPEKVIMHGDINGIVTDLETSQLLEAVTIKLNPINDTTSTESDGRYLFRNILPGNYSIEASKPLYESIIQDVMVFPASTSTVDIPLLAIPYPEFSEKHLDFGLDSVMSFTVKNIGTGKLRYFLNQNQNWIILNKSFGNLTNSNSVDTILVTVNRTGLSENKQIGLIEIVSFLGGHIFQDTVKVYLNGVLDRRDSRFYRFYGIVKIGTQVWMAENLNVGNMKFIQEGDADEAMLDNGISEKYCYDNLESNCDIYGGLYMWDEMMQYTPPDNGIIGTTQGICMDGWHIPTIQEWEKLIFYLGGFRNYGLPPGLTIYQGGVGGKLKDTGPLWIQPNIGATNESGFSALPGGGYSGPGFDPGGGYYPGNFNNKRSITGFCSSMSYFNFNVNNSNSGMDASSVSFLDANSVRCVKNPVKK
jgi:uncharacterized protein (TIGR02145 family)